MPPPLFIATATVCEHFNGQPFFRSANASSALSREDALELARELARKRAVAAAHGKAPVSERGRYPYPERVLIEPVLETIRHEGNDLGRITRNSYQAQVLNAWRVMFVDVDTEPETNGQGSAPDPMIAKTEALGALGELIRSHGELGFRIYETRSGLRYLCTSHLFDPQSPESADIMKRLHADKRYATLCRVQKCYRARLTPKPWRCDYSLPEPSGFFRRLFGRRIARDPSKFAACRYVRSVGSPMVEGAETGVIAELHDRMTRAGSKLPLA